MLFHRKRLFSSFVTPDFKKRQNRNETSLKKGTKFTGIFASLVIKLQTPLVLKVQTRATLEQNMMPTKKWAIPYNNKKKHAQNENNLAIEMRKLFIEAATERCSSNLCLAAFIKSLKNICEGVKFSK